EPGKIHLTLAARFRDSGFKNGIMDDLQVFDTALTEPEVKSLGAPASPARTSDPASISTNDTHDSAKTQGAFPPLPGGEGRGEGEQLLTYFLTHQCAPY